MKFKKESEIMLKDGKEYLIKLKDLMCLHNFFVYRDEGHYVTLVYRGGRGEAIIVGTYSRVDKVFLVTDRDGDVMYTKPDYVCDCVITRGSDNYIAVL